MTHMPEPYSICRTQGNSSNSSPKTRWAHPSHGFAPMRLARSITAWPVSLAFSCFAGGERDARHFGDLGREVGLSTLSHVTCRLSEPHFGVTSSKGQAAIPPSRKDTFGKPAPVEDPLRLVTPQAHLAERYDLLFPGQLSQSFTERSKRDVHGPVFKGKPHLLSLGRRSNVDKHDVPVALLDPSPEFKGGDALRNAVELVLSDDTASWGAAGSPDSKRLEPARLRRPFSRSVILISVPFLQHPRR